MENIISYIDELGNNVKIEKTIVEDIEWEVTSINDLLITQKVIQKGQFKNLSFFVFSIEQLTEMLQKSNTISFIYRHFQNTYQINEYLDYENCHLSGKMISVYNSVGEHIFFRKYLFVDGKPNSHFTEKYYYENDEVKYTFIYNKDGTCFVVNDEQQHYEDIYGFEIGTSKTSFTWKGFEYYEFEDPIVPEQRDT